MHADRFSDAQLRIKYLDWCSAQVADRFLRLSPEEVFTLAERATHAESVASASSSVAVGELTPAAFALWKHLAPGGAAETADSGSAGASYVGAVAQITELLAGQLGLPVFEDWLLAYREDPEPFDREIMGFRSLNDDALGEES
jgi:hypothetical protein